METSDGGNLEKAIIFGEVFRTLEKNGVNCKDYNSNSCRGLNSCCYYAKCQNKTVLDQRSSQRGGGSEK